ncbi:MAG: glycosyltransferase family 2 protein [Oligoflexia bacterium]|nr:glycosyltransferase family 2 protein [Oligoflexia bacterium]
MTTRLSIVTPIYNEVDNIPRLIEEVERAIRPHFPDFELIAVDDGSKDGSSRLLREKAKTHPFLKVITLLRNCGQSAAFDAGIQHASGQIIATMDADLQNDPQDIPRLVEMLGEDYDVVTGWRKRRQDGFFWRKLPSLIANAIVRKVTGTRIHDLGCSLKVYRGSVIKELRLYGEMHRYICPLLENMGARIAEAEVHHRPRTAGVSKYGIARVFKVLLDMIYVWFNKSYQTKPMYVFGGAGVTLLGMSFLLTALAAWEKLNNGVYVHRNPVFLIALILLVIAFQFFGIGLIAELLVRTYFESKGRDSYLIRERIGFHEPLAGQKSERVAEFDVSL